MKFNVEFKAVGQNNSAVSIGNKQGGLELLDAARKHFGVQLPAERVSDTVYACFTNPEIKVPEDQARETGRFQDAASVIVRVPGASLNDFAERVFDVGKDSQTGEILSVRARMEPNQAAILAAWMTAGCPMQWDPRPANDEGFREVGDEEEA